MKTRQSDTLLCTDFPGFWTSVHHQWPTLILVLVLTLFQRMLSTKQDKYAISEWCVDANTGLYLNVRISMAWKAVTAIKGSGSQPKGHENNIKIHANPIPFIRSFLRIGCELFCNWTRMVSVFPPLLLQQLGNLPRREEGRYRLKLNNLKSPGKLKLSKFTDPSPWLWKASTTAGEKRLWPIALENLL